MTLTIAGVDRSDQVLWQTLERVSVLSSQVDTLQFSMRLTDAQLSSIPKPTQEVILEIAGVREFGGIIVNAPREFLGDSRTGEIVVQITAQDYQTLLNRRLATRTYQNQNAGAIVSDLVGIVGGFNLANVQSGPLVADWRVNYQPLGDAIEDLAKTVGYEWWIDYYKNVYFRQPANPNAPWDLIEDSSPPYVASAPYGNLTYIDDVSQIRNLVYVKGATVQSNLVQQRVTGDGITRVFGLTLGQRIVRGSLTMSIDGVAQTVGEKNQIDPGLVSWLVDYENRVVEATSGTPTPANGASIVFQYRYESTILINARDNESINTYGIWESIVVNEDIKDRSVAIQVAKAALNDQAWPEIGLTYTTTRPGLAVGQVQRVNIPRLGISGDFLIREVRLRIPSYLSGNTGFQSNDYYRVWTISAQRLGRVTY